MLLVLYYISQTCTNSYLQFYLRFWYRYLIKKLSHLSKYVWIISNRSELNTPNQARSWERIKATKSPTTAFYFTK